MQVHLQSPLLQIMEHQLLLMQMESLIHVLTVMLLLGKVGLSLVFSIGVSLDVLSRFTC